MINNLASRLASKFCEEPKIILLKYRPTDAKVKYFKVHSRIAFEKFPDKIHFSISQL